MNRVIDFIEEHLTEEIDIANLTSDLGTTKYHVRRMFSSLAGMPMSEYIRRRRRTVVAADVIGDRDLLVTPRICSPGTPSWIAKEAFVLTGEPGVVTWRDDLTLSRGPHLVPQLLDKIRVTLGQLVLDRKPGPAHRR